MGKELTLSLEDLKTRFPRHTVMAAIQCGGNRRKEMKDRKMLKVTVASFWHVDAVSGAQLEGRGHW